MEHHRIRVSSETPEHHKKVIYETTPRCTIGRNCRYGLQIYVHNWTQNNNRGLPSTTLLQLIRSMRPIQQPQRSIIQIELLMMKIMRSSLVTKEIISTVNRRRIEKLISQEYPEGHNMASQQLRRQGDRQCISEDVFNRMGELRSQSDRSSESVMFLMDADVESGYM